MVLWHGLVNRQLAGPNALKVKFLHKLARVFEHMLAKVMALFRKVLEGLGWTPNGKNESLGKGS